jgi:hypothetical protein
MRFAIDLDSQPRIAAKEVEHIWAGRVLSAEFQAVRALSEFAPKQDFRK